MDQAELAKTSRLSPGKAQDRHPVFNPKQDAVSDTLCIESKRIEKVELHNGLDWLQQVGSDGSHRITVQAWDVLEQHGPVAYRPHQTNGKL
jgi:hypothetical protein